LSPLDMSTYTELGPDRLRFAGLIPEILIFRPKKSIQTAFSLQKFRAFYSVACQLELNISLKGPIALLSQIGRAMLCVVCQ